MSAEIKLVEAQIARGDRAGALQRLSELLRGDLNNAHLWFLVAVATTDTEKRNKALTKALKLDPQHADARKFAQKLGLIPTVPSPSEPQPTPVTVAPPRPIPAPHIEVLTLKCPNCGAALEIRDDVDHLACGFCRTSLMVRRSGGTISLSRVEQQLGAIQGSINRVEDHTARSVSELAIPRLNGDRIQLINEIEALVLPSGKGSAFVSILLGGLLGAPLLCGLLAVQGSSLAGDTASISIIFLIPCALAVVWGIYRYFRLDRQEKEVQAEYERLSKELSYVDLQIANHRRIVDPNSPVIPISSTKQKIAAPQKAVSTKPEKKNGLSCSGLIGGFVIIILILMAQTSNNDPLSGVSEAHKDILRKKDWALQQLYDYCVAGYDVATRSCSRWANDALNDDTGKQIRVIICVELWDSNQKDAENTAELAIFENLFVSCLADEGVYVADMRN